MDLFELQDRTGPPGVSREPPGALPLGGKPRGVEQSGLVGRDEEMRALDPGERLLDQRRLADLSGPGYHL